MWHIRPPGIVYVEVSQLHLQSKSFVQQATIHGIREAWLTKSKPVRFLWMVILFGCLCGLVYEIYHIVRYYESNPSASQIKWIVRDAYDYPPMVFCPKTFLNMEKVKGLNMSKSALAYTVSLFQHVDQSSLPESYQSDEARKEVKFIIRKYNLKSYEELFAAIAFDGRDVIYDALSGKTIKLEIYVPGYGLCYRMHLPPVKAESPLKTVSYLELEHVPSEKSTQYDFIHDTALLVRDSTGIKADMIMLSKQAYYQIDFQVELHKRLSRSGLECLSSDKISEKYYVTDCETACLDKEMLNSGCVNCLPYQLLNGIDDVIEPCSNIKSFSSIWNETIGAVMNASVRCEQDEIIASAKPCLSKCLPVCEQWLFKHSTITFDAHNLSVYLRFLYNPSAGILTYEEVPTYNFDTFISNIGGQLGLWLGASVVSVFQIFYYSCLAMFSQEGKIIVTKI